MAHARRSHCSWNGILTPIWKVEDVRKSRPESAALAPRLPQCSGTCSSSTRRCIHGAGGWRFKAPGVWQAGAVGRVLNPLHSTSKPKPYLPRAPTQLHPLPCFCINERRGFTSEMALRDAQCPSETLAAQCPFQVTRVIEVSLKTCRYHPGLCQIEIIGTEKKH